MMQQVWRPPFCSVCVRWGPPGIVRSDNGSEFRNALTHALFEAFGVVVQHGAVRHPQSQGSVERFNRDAADHH